MGIEPASIANAVTIDTIRLEKLINLFEVFVYIIEMRSNVTRTFSVESTNMLTKKIFAQSQNLVNDES